MATNYYLKLYYEILGDPKMGLLSDRLFRRVIEAFLMAGRLDADGCLPPLSEIVWTLHTNEAEIQAEFEAIAKMTGILRYDENRKRWLVVNYKKRQAPLTAAERKRRQRQKQNPSSPPPPPPDPIPNNPAPRHGVVTDDVTKRDISSHVKVSQNVPQSESESESELKSESESEIDLSSSSVKEGGMGGDFSDDDGHLPDSLLADLETIGWEGSTAKILEIYSKIPKLITEWLTVIKNKNGKLHNPAGFFNAKISAGKMPPVILTDEERRQRKHREDAAKYGCEY